MSKLMRSVSGIRGIVGPDFNPILIAGYVNAFVQLLNAKRVVVGRDTRPTGTLVEHCVVSALQASGADVVMVGIASTPTVEMEVIRQKADAGIIITASHNPLEWNALKFLNHEGIFLDEGQVRDLFALVDAENFAWVDHSRAGVITHETGADEAHIRAILALPYIDVQALRARRFKTAYDAVNGAGCLIVPQLLKELGCDITAIHVTPDGIFPRGAEPTPENLGDLGRAVVQNGCDVGFATDPDADRCALVDERGEPVGEEYTLAIAVDFMLRHKPGPVTVNLSTSRMNEDLAERHGSPFARSKVGEINVTVEMRRNGSVIGGEGNGGVILPDLHYGRDGILAVALTLQSLLDRETTLSGLVAAIPAYHIDKRKFDLGSKSLADVYARLEEAFKEARLDRRDGLWFGWEKSWLHVRPSNTEPVIRAIAEAPTREEAARLCDAVSALL
ncbi:MAG: putative phosphomannomutase [Fibrobacteria bacterium]|jgi:phosphomannomutase|nr:putative phosphomannomutase [Fibrobacteria bacterium]